MPIEPRDFLTQSRELVKSDEEVDHRTAISRAYYCALHSCISLCECLPSGFKDDASSSHESVIKNLKACPSEMPFGQYRKEFLTLANQLRKGKNQRVRADYKISLSIDKTAATEHLDKMGLVSVRATHLCGNLNASSTSKSA